MPQPYNPQAAYDAWARDVRIVGDARSRVVRFRDGRGARVGDVVHARAYGRSEKVVGTAVGIVVAVNAGGAIDIALNDSTDATATLSRARRGAGRCWRSDALNIVIIEPQ